MSSSVVTRKRKQATDDFVQATQQKTKKQRSTAAKASVQAANTQSGTQTANAASAPITDHAPETKSSKRQREQEEVRTPQNKRFKDAIPPTPSDTPTRGASRLFDKLNLVAEVPKTTSKEAIAYSSPPITPQSKRGANLPPAVEESIQLFVAFHSAWSLFIAHNGLGTPMHVIEMLARATATWKKRRVTLDDVRRLLGVLGDDSPFLMIDNGDGDMCLELKSEAAMVTILQTKKLIHEFELRVRRAWKQWCDAGNEGDARGDTFLKSLPMAETTKSEVAADPNRLTRGAIHLQSIKASAPTTSEISTKKIAPVAAAAKTQAAVAERGASLIDRIMAKEALAASRPSGPTREELERLSALDRIEEVVLVLGLLAGSRPRASFSMQMLVQHLRNSSRNPIAKDEAERCVTLMATEVCPRFVSQIQSGGLNVVVIMKAGRLSTEELRARVLEAKRR